MKLALISFLWASSVFAASPCARFSDKDLKILERIHGVSACCRGRGAPCVTTGGTVFTRDPRGTWQDSRTGRRWSGILPGEKDQLSAASACARQGFGLPEERDLALAEESGIREALGISSGRYWGTYREQGFTARATFLEGDSGRVLETDFAQDERESFALCIAR